MKCLITDQPPSPQHLAVSTTTDCCQLPIHLHSWVAIGQGFNLHAVGASRSLMNSIAADRLSPKNLLRLMRSGDDGRDSSSIQEEILTFFSLPAILESYPNNSFGLSEVIDCGFLSQCNSHSLYSIHSEFCGCPVVSLGGFFCFHLVD